MCPLQVDDVTTEIAIAERKLNESDQLAFRLWERMRIPPCQWGLNQYPGVQSAWVVAILGCRCMYYNEVEDGWGWGEYINYKAISEFHWEQDEIHHMVFQTAFALREGGNG